MAASQCFTIWKRKKHRDSMFPCFYLTNRFKVAMCLFSNRSQMTSKCGKNKKVAHKVQPSVSLMFLPHFDVLCDLLLNRCMADIWVTDVPISLTNRFHVAVLLFSYRWQVMSECGYCKNKKSCTRGTAECVTAVLSTFWLFLWSITVCNSNR